MKNKIKHFVGGEGCQLTTYGLLWKQNSLATKPPPPPSYKKKTGQTAWKQKGDLQNKYYFSKKCFKSKES